MKMNDRRQAVATGRSGIIRRNSRITTPNHSKHLRVATLNIGTLTSRTRELADLLKHRRVDIACLQETRWKGQKSRDIGDGYKLIYHGTSNQRGVAVVVSAELRACIAEVHRHSDRLMSIVIDTAKRRLRVYSAYAPQTGCDDQEKDDFWQLIQDHVAQCPAEDLLLLCGDLNGHVGREKDGYDCHGGRGYGNRNDDGRRILDFAEAGNLAICNTFFMKRTSHLITYASAEARSQIDFILLRRQNLSIVTDTKVIPSDNLAPQHKLLIADLKVKAQRSTGVVKGPPVIKWWKLNEHSPALAAAVSFPDIPVITTDPTDPGPINAAWTALRTSVTSAAKTILGTVKPGRRRIDKQAWLWTDEVQKKVREKKALFRVWRENKTEENRQRYVTAKREAKAAVAIARAEHHRKLYEQLDTPEGEKNIYRLAKARDRATRDIEHYVCIKDKEGRKLTNTRHILERWREHFNDISNIEFPHPSISEGLSISGPVPHITTAEVTTAIRSMKNQKAPGPDELPADVWKLAELCDSASTWLAAFFNEIVRSGHAPSEWATSTTVPIFKNKGDPAQCSNYRPIRLLAHTMKIFERILDQRLRAIIEVSKNQCGFVKGCGTTDAIFAARQLMEKHREKRKPLHMAFLDLEKAFDRVPHKLIWFSLRDHGVPERLVDWVKLLYEHTTSQVRCAAGTSRSFPVNVGVHQGSALSPLLFILVMDTVTRDLQREVPWTLLYADDVMLATTSRDDLQRSVQCWSDRLDQFGLRLNTTKTEYLELDPTEGTVRVNAKDLPKTDTFKYLGTNLQSDGNIDREVRARVGASWFRWRAVTGVLCDRKMPTCLKSKIYRTVVRPVALYGTECWPATGAAERRLHAMEMQMTRWALRISLLDHVTNDTIRHKMGIAPITDMMQQSRLRWYGHVRRAPLDSVVGIANELEVDGKRPRGRPKQRWRDTIRSDMKARSMSPSDAFDRMKWRSMILTADPATG